MQVCRGCGGGGNVTTTTTRGRGGEGRGEKQVLMFSALTVHTGYIDKTVSLLLSFLSVEILRNKQTLCYLAVMC